MSNWKITRQQQLHERLNEQTPTVGENAPATIVQLFSGKRPRDMEEYEGQSLASKPQASA